MPLALPDIARLEEIRLATVIAEIADESRPFAGGTMARSTPGSWCNYAAGFGLDGPASRDDVDAMIRFYEEKGIEPRLETCPFVHKDLLAIFEDLRFVVRQFEFIYFRELDRATPARTPFAPPPGLRIDAVDKRDQAAVRRFALLAMSGFYPPGTGPSDDDIRLCMKSTKNPRTVPVVASIDATPVGAGGMEVVGDVATLFGVSVLPEYRGRGVQQALLAHRLNLAAERGAKIATIGSLPASPTERNARRMGFQVAYVKAILVRPGEGLARMRI